MCGLRAGTKHWTYPKRINEGASAWKDDLTLVPPQPSLKGVLARSENLVTTKPLTTAEGRLRPTEAASGALPPADEKHRPATLSQSEDRKEKGAKVNLNLEVAQQLPFIPHFLQERRRPKGPPPGGSLMPHGISPQPRARPLCVEGLGHRQT